MQCRAVRLSADQRIMCQHADGYPQQYLLGRTRGPVTDVIHFSVMYFIDPQGRERFLASLMADHTVGGSSYLPAGQLSA